jgi:hypothetical protein
MTSQMHLPGTATLLLAGARTARERADAAEEAAVAQARGEGWSWDRIGTALAVPGETLRRRYAAPAAIEAAPQPAAAPDQAPAAQVTAAPARTDRRRAKVARVRTGRGRSVGVQVVLFSTPREPRGV